MTVTVLAAEGFWSVTEATRFLGVSRTRMYELMADGTLPVVTHGERSRLIPKAAVKALAEKWLAEAERDQ